jgi:hypothetical protein
MSRSEQFPYLNLAPTSGASGFRPYLPVTLTHQQSSIDALALLDTGASINVLPYALGLDLGYLWERQTTTINLTGNLANYEARVIVAELSIGSWEPIELVFAWTQFQQIPLNFRTSQLLHGI